MVPCNLSSPHDATAPSGPRPPHYRGFTINLTKNNIHKRQTSMPQAGFESTVPASEPPQTRAVDGVATGIDVVCFNQYYI
jgi:hypothetical protein